eukprot:1784317-Prymnesium_polylepis.1
MASSRASHGACTRRPAAREHRQTNRVVRSRAPSSIENDRRGALKALVSDVAASAMLDTSGRHTKLRGVIPRSPLLHNPRGAVGVMPTGSEYGDGRVMRPPQEVGTHGWRPWSGEILSVRIAKENIPRAYA